MWRGRTRKWCAVLILVLVTGLFAGLTAFAGEPKMMLAKGEPSGTSGVKVTWQPVKGATGYKIYYTPCKTSFTEKKTVRAGGSAKTYTIRNLNKSGQYKFYVAAMNKSGVIAKSLLFHVAKKNHRQYTNARSISIAPKSMTIAAGSTVQASATVKKVNPAKQFMEDSHDKKIRYISSNPAVAKVGAKGKITAVKAGSCQIYAIAQNGMWAASKVKVTEGGTQKNTFSVTYKYTGTVPKGAPKVPAKQSYKKGASVKKAAVPKLKGYEFLGWSGEVTTMPGEDVTVTGHWKAKEYKLSYAFSYVGAEPDSEDAPKMDSVMVKYEKKKKKPTAPKLKGYRFDGWTCKYTSMPAEEVTMTGTFVKQCKVTYLLYGTSIYDENYGQRPVFLDKKTVYFDAGKKVTLKELADFEEFDPQEENWSFSEQLYRQARRYVEKGLTGKGPGSDLFPDNYDFKRDLGMGFWRPAAQLLNLEAEEESWSMSSQILRDLGGNLGADIPGFPELLDYILNDDAVLCYLLYYAPAQL